MATCSSPLSIGPEHVGGYVTETRNAWPAKPAVTFPVAERHRPLTSTTLLDDRDTRE